MSRPILISMPAPSEDAANALAEQAGWTFTFCPKAKIDPPSLGRKTWQVSFDPSRLTKVESRQLSAFAAGISLGATLFADSKFRTVHDLVGQH